MRNGSEETMGCCFLVAVLGCRGTFVISILCFPRMELRCVIAVIRHGDRTPKQKMKMEVKHPR